MVAATGTSTLGLFVWTFSVAIAAWIAKRFLNWLEVRKAETGLAAIRSAFKGGLQEGACELGAIGFVAALAWGCFLPLAAYRDHQELNSENERLSQRVDHLSQFAKNEELLNHKLTEAESKTDNYQQAYLGISKKERVPDRILNAEESDKLHANLVRDAKANKNKSFLRVDVSPVFYDDRESSKFAFQILQVFQESGWDARWPKSRSGSLTTFFRTSMPVGVAIYSDDRNKGQWVALELRDAGIDADVSHNPPPDIKGTLICVGYKQFP